jgi:Immunoglobulin-like domain of bacterial spore germination
MTTEDRLREAIRARTSEVEPSPPSESLRKIEQRLAATRRATARRRLLVGLTSAAAVLAVVVLAVTVLGDDGGREVRTSDDRTTSTSSSTTSSSTTTSTTEPSSTTSGSTTSTTAPSSTATTAVPPSGPSGGVDVDPTVMIWPALGSSTRFDDPVAAAQSFAVDLVGFRDPVVEAFEADGSDGTSGSVVVRPRAQGPATTVQVRQGDGTWWVVSAGTADITLDQPATRAQIACPLRLTGTALAFEGTVNVTVRDDERTEVGSGFVTGGGDVPRPFDGTIDCSLESARSGSGTVILTEASAEDGSVVKAVARRVLLLAG